MNRKYLVQLAGKTGEKMKDLFQTRVVVSLFQVFMFLHLFHHAILSGKNCKQTKPEKKTTIYCFKTLHKSSKKTEKNQFLKENFFASVLSWIHRFI